MRHFITTGKLGTAGREYRIHSEEGLQCKDQSGGWFHSNFTMNSFMTMFRLGGIKEV